MAFNKLTDAQAEALALLAEECAETIQTVGKILRHGLFSHHPNDLEGPTNHDMLNRELGDIRAAKRLCQRQGLINGEAVADAARAKLHRVRQYLHHVTVDDGGY